MDGQTMNQSTLLIVFIAVTAVAEALQSRVNDQVLPMMEKARTLVDESVPKLQTVVTNLTESSGVIRAQVEKIDGVVTQIVENVRTQASRIDVLTTRTLERVDSTAATVQHTVTSPIRRIGGVVEGVIAGIGSFAGKRKETRTGKAVPSEDMFI